MMYHPHHPLKSSTFINLPYTPMYLSDIYMLIYLFFI